MFTPVNPNVTIEKWDVRRYKSHGYVFMMMYIVGIRKKRVIELSRFEQVTHNLCLRGKEENLCKLM